ncbi:MAG: hypothetical protein IH840_16485, partial [Candidatus Heimdallarchaeota archaeon]|nr:hypothetical protein [Candidatus Heimdallarchaeota archaeon]
KAKLLTIPGLGILESKNLNRISEFNQDLLANLKDSIKFCKKIIPLEFYSKYSEQKLINWVIKAKNRLFKAIHYSRKVCGLQSNHTS